MSTKNVFMMGFLSMIAATGMFVALNGYAADAQLTSTSEGVAAKAMSDEMKISEAPAPHGQVQLMDSKGNAYLLIPCKTNDGEACVVEYVVPYTNPTSH